MNAIDLAYKEAILAIDGEPFTDEWCKAAAAASEVSKAAFGAEKESRVLVEVVDADGETVQVARNERVCRSCGDVFTIEVKRGRPPVECPTCKGK